MKHGASRALVGVAVLLSMVNLSCAVDRQAGSEPVQPTPSPIWATVPPRPGFTFSDKLECTVVLSSHGPRIGSRLRIEGALGSTATVTFGSGKVMTRLLAADDRVVFQAIGEEPGSVDTLSVDARTGLFARVWSGWSKEALPVVNGGVERGSCSAMKE